METPTNNRMDYYEANRTFAQLLERVEAGEEITITKQGQPVTQLVRAMLIRSSESRQEAINKMRGLANRNRLADLHVPDLIAEGRE